MPDELIERREALRSLDRRLTAVRVDIDEITDEANKMAIWAGPVGVSFDVGTAGPEGAALEELGEIAHELQVLVEDEVVPEIADKAGWSVTAERRIDELQAMVVEMQEVVRRAFDETVAQLPPEIESQPLAEPELDDPEFVAPGDNRKRNYAIFVGVWTVVVLSFFVAQCFVDMDAVEAACERPSPCEGDEPEVEVYPGGELVVHRKNAACEAGVQVLFDAEGTFVLRSQPGEAPGVGWPSGSPRGRASCAEAASLRWTWTAKWR